MTERPVECGQCKKPAAVIYKEIAQGAMICTEMCADCPVLQQKLYGTGPAPQSKEGWAGAEAGLCCSNCRTTFEAVKMGNPLGCPDCYAVFGNLLISELVAAGKIPARLREGLNMRKPQSIHVGRSPDKPQQAPTSNRLTSLHEALNEALKKENYEEAAFLRDQIKELMDKGNEP